MPIWIYSLIAYLSTKIDLFQFGFFIASNIRLPYIKKIQLTETRLKALENELQHGDLLFGRREWFLKNTIVPGYYKHVGSWDAEKKLVIEMQDDGYTESTLQQFIERYTEVGIGRPFFTKEYATLFIKTLRTFSDKDYDSKFSQNTSQMYCSESIHCADVENKLKYSTTKVLWKQVYIPHELLNLPTVKKIMIIKKPNFIEYFEA